MNFKTEVRINRLFRTEAFLNSFKDLFFRGDNETDSVEIGPLAFILDEYLLIPAKGGSSEKLEKWPDVTYFTHVLNGMVISGKILEKKYFSRSNQTEQETEKYIRLFFAAIVAHDADKLFKEGIHGAYHLDMVLEKPENKKKLIKMFSYYLRSLGNPEQWWNDLKFLILRDENRTFDFANELETNSNRQQLETLAKYIRLGDQVGGIKNDLSKSIFNQMKKFLHPFLSDLNEEVHLIQFNDLPQTILLDQLYQEFVNFFRDQDREVITYFPDAIAYLGKELTDKEYKEIEEKYEEKFSGESEEYINNVIKSFAPSGNSIRLDFNRSLNPTVKVVKKYIETYNSRLLIWQGEEWKDKNQDFIIKVNIFGIPLREVTKKDNKKSYKVDFPEYSEEVGDEEIRKRRLLCLIAFGRRVFHEINKKMNIEEYEEHEFVKKNFGDGIFEGSNLLQHKTIEAIGYACMVAEKDTSELEKIYDDICEYISDKLKKLKEKDNDDELKDFFDRALGRNILIQEPPDKEEMCIFCGVHGGNILREDNSFGIKPTSGTGKKISTLMYNEKRFNGKICNLCIKENELRIAQIGRLKESLSFHVYLGDYFVPIFPDQVIETLKGILDNKGRIGFSTGDVEDSKETIFLRINKKNVGSLGYHMVALGNKPKGENISKKKIEEFQLLFDVLDFISKTGLKVRLTSLLSTKRIFLPIFEWDNSPGWVKNLGMSQVRIDEIERRIKLLELMLNVSYIDDGENSLSRVIIDVNRSKRGMFRILSKYMNKNVEGRINWDGFPKIKERLWWYMNEYSKELNKSKMDVVVEKACGITKDPPVSNNDNSWMFREAMRIYLRYLKNDEKDLMEKIASRIWDYAKRENKYASEESQNNSIGFAKAFIDLMKSEFKNKIPPPEERKDLTYQFALMYNIRKWEMIKNKKKGDENNGK